jgi:hypothetical protein
VQSLSNDQIRQEIIGRFVRMAFIPGLAVHIYSVFDDNPTLYWMASSRRDALRSYGKDKASAQVTRVRFYVPLIRNFLFILVNSICRQHEYIAISAG